MINFLIFSCLLQLFTDSWKDSLYPFLQVLQEPTNHKRAFLSLSTVKGERIVLLLFSRRSTVAICMITSWEYVCLAVNCSRRSYISKRLKNPNRKMDWNLIEKHFWSGYDFGPLAFTTFRFGYRFRFWCGLNPWLH